MSRRRRTREPDKRLDWRDKDMPVLRMMEFGWGERRLEAVSPEEESEHCTSMVQNNNPLAPNWRDDETYNLARPGARRRRR